MSSAKDLSGEVADCVPFLRRYARALAGNQTAGDTYALAALETLLSDRGVIDGASSVKVGLYRVFQAMWRSSGAKVTEGETALQARVQKHLSSLTENSREALLLSTIEEFDLPEVAEIMQISVDEAAHLTEVARSEMADAIAGSLMIIEDEAVIAMDLEALVGQMGHRVTGIARTHKEAVALAAADKPDLILADIQLADNSSGNEAVKDILSEYPDLPVIFITAFPEQLLTGERPEPAFMISKPYTNQQVRSAVSQAMFFASTETLQS